MGYANTRECYVAIGDKATNLIVEQPGTQRVDEIVLLGAHYDTVFTTPGADDNASAVAVMLEVSRLLLPAQRLAIRPAWDSQVDAPLFSSARQFSRGRRQHAFMEIVLAVPPRLQTRNATNAVVFNLLAREDPRNSTQRQQFVLGPRLPGADADRHQLPSQSKLSSSNRHSRHTRLCPHDRSYSGRGCGNAKTAWLRFLFCFSLPTSIRRCLGSMA